MRKSWVRWLLLVAAVSPAIVPLYMILRYGVDFPYWDQWEPYFAGLYVKWHQGQLGWVDLMAQHNEHRMLVPRIVFLIVNSLTHWNVIFEMVVQWIAVLMTSVLVLWLDHLNQRDLLPQGQTAFPTNQAIVLWFLANVLVFSPTQVENWLWGIGLCNVMPMLFIMAAIVTARCGLGIWIRTGLVIFLCSAATFSSGSGAVSWVLAGVVLIWPDNLAQWRARKWVIAALIGAAIVNAGIYLHGYVVPEHTDQQVMPVTFGWMLHYFILYTGSANIFAMPWILSTNATIAGTIIFILYLFSLIYFLHVWWRNDTALCRRMLVWHAVAGYAIASGLLTTASRAGMGISSALSSRYIAFALYLPLALVYLIALIAGDIQRRFGLGRLARLWPLGLAALLVMGGIAPIPKIMEISRGLLVARRQGKAAMLLVKILPDNPLIAAAVMPHPERVREFAPALNEMGYLRPRLIKSANAALLQPADVPPDAVQGSIDGATRSSPASISIQGWAIFPRWHRPADAVLVCYNNKQGEPTIFGMAPLMVERPDQAAALNDSAYRFCGWGVDLYLAGLPASPQNLVITVWALDVDSGNAYQLNGSTTIRR